MLIKPRFMQLDSQMHVILTMIGNGKSGANEIMPGIYEINHFSFDKLIKNKINEYPYTITREALDEVCDGEFDDYGVSDDVEQIKAKYAKLINHPDYNICISISKIVKAEQSSRGGWRWHKWGEYIGTKNPQCEYIYDEDDSIEFVYVYHVYVLLD